MPILPRSLSRSSPPCAQTRCYCQPNPLIETSRPACSMIRERCEKKPGWPDRIGIKGYAGFLLGISNPEEGGEEERGGTASSSVTAVEERPADNEEVAEKSGEVDDSTGGETASSTPASSAPTASSSATADNEEDNEVEKRNYVHTGAGTFAQAKVWKGRNTALPSESNVKFFERSPSPLEEEERKLKGSSPTPRIKIEEGGMEEKREGEAEGEAEVQGLEKGEGVEEIPGLRRRDEGWRRVLRVLGCGWV